MFVTIKPAKWLRCQPETAEQKKLNSSFPRSKMLEMPTENTEQKKLNSSFPRSKMLEMPTENTEQKKLNSSFPRSKMLEMPTENTEQKKLNSSFPRTQISNRKRGFSLLEILIAVAIFASSLLFIFPSIKKSENEIKKNLRTLQALNRTLYSYSRIQNKVYRLALKTHLQKSSYWVEVKTPLTKTLIQPNTELSDTPEESVSIEESPFFQKDTQIFNTQELPDGLYFEWTDNTVESETIYITYDPHLLTHQVQIFLRKGSDFTWTLSFNPILGELEILEGENESP